MILVISSEIFQQWRIVFERSDGAALVHDVDGEDDDAEAGVPEHGWRTCDVAGGCKEDDTLTVTGKYNQPTKPIQNMEILVVKYPDTIKLSSTGQASEKYPDSLGEYHLFTDEYHNGRPVYQSLARDDRYIINIGE